VKIQALSFTQRRDWLRLSRTQNVGPVAFRDLLKRYGSAGEALGALPSLIRRKTIKPPTIEQVEAEMEASENLGIKLIAACEPDFPPYLRAINPPPPIISVWGHSAILHKKCVAIVGSRNSSALGLKFAASLAHDLGQAGYVIVSGLARGIDASAHHASLETGTAAVLGGGVDHVYPRQNAELYEHIQRQGALISESPLGYRAGARDFPRRNRIISGLSAAPGSPLDPRTKGCNRLIQQGAALIESAEDVIHVLENLRAPMMMETGDNYEAAPFDYDAAQKDIEAAGPILRGLLSATPTPRDDIIRASGLTAAIVNAALLEMELNADILVEMDGRVALNF